MEQMAVCQKFRAGVLGETWRFLVWVEAPPQTDESCFGVALNVYHPVYRIEKRTNAAGNKYPWIVKVAVLEKIVNTPTRLTLITRGLPWRGGRFGTPVEPEEDAPDGSGLAASLPWTALAGR